MIQFDTLRSENKLANITLGLEAAQRLGVPMLLDPDDFGLEKLSMCCYLSEVTTGSRVQKDYHAVGVQTLGQIVVRHREVWTLRLFPARRSLVRRKSGSSRRHPIWFPGIDHTHYFKLASHEIMKHTGKKF